MLICFHQTLITLLLLLLCSFSYLLAQEKPLPPSRVVVIIGEEKTDVVIDTNGNSVKAQVIEITIDAIKYKKADNLEGPVYTIPKSTIHKIVFKNGSEEIFNKQSILPTPSQTADEYVPTTTTILPTTTIITNSKTATSLNNSSNSCLQGEQDATMYHNRTGGNFLLGFAFGVFGVGFAAIGDVKSPSLVYVAPEKINDPVYMNCYNKKAKRKNINSSLLVH